MFGAAVGADNALRPNGAGAHHLPDRVNEWICAEGPD